MPIADNLIAFTLAATLLTLTPGLDTALILRTATVEGRKQGVRAALGINAGCLLWGAAVAFGLGALIAVSELAYNILKYCGAAYLAWLGLNMLLHPRQSLAPAGEDGQRAGNWFFKGMMGNLLNPKVGIFYVSFLPQFIPQGQPLVAWTFGLVSIHVALGWLAVGDAADWRDPAVGGPAATGQGHPVDGPCDRPGIRAVRGSAGAGQAIGAERRVLHHVERAIEIAFPMIATAIFRQKRGQVIGQQYRIQREGEGYVDQAH